MSRRSRSVRSALLVVPLATVLALAGVARSDVPDPAGSPTAQPTPLPAGSPTAEPAPGAALPEAALPEPEATLPTRPAGLAGALRDTTVRLRRAVDAWQGDGDLQRDAPPEDVTLLALHQQRLVFSLVRRPRTTAQVVERLPESVRGEVRDTLAARVALTRIPVGRPIRRPRLRTGPALPPGRLRGYYDAAERRFGIRWELLAAVNFVETGFNKLRNESTAGAQGPMQFIPSTWRAYGMGGDIRSPRDAIMGAANYLRASGGRSDERRALFAYNRSTAYGSAVLLHARRIARDPRHFLALYSWQIFVRRDGRLVRLTGPGL